LVNSISLLTLSAGDAKNPTTALGLDAAKSEDGNSMNGDAASTASGDGISTTSSRDAEAAAARKKVREEEIAAKKNWTRAASTALRPLTMGALSAFSVVYEAREMRSTLDKIKAGSPSEKAATLRQVGSEIDKFPGTTALSQSCRKFFQL